jgi:hypothetical protein
VYLLEVENYQILGYAQPEGLLRDNPNSPTIEAYAAYSHLVLDNDFSYSDDPFSLMRATAAHEFHHIIQHGYDLNDEALWYYEATATWMETQTFPDAQDATNYVDALFVSPGLCPGNTVNDVTGSRIYAEWLFIDSMVQDYGTGILLDLWDLIAAEEGMDSLYNLLNKLGTTPQEVFQRYAVRNLLLDYALSGQFNSTVHVSASLTDAGRAISRGTGVQELGVNYLASRLNGVYTLSVQEENLELLYVGINSNEASVFNLENKGSVDTTPFTDGYVLVFNTSAHDAPDACQAVRWTLTVTEGGAPQDVSFTWDARRFIQP